MALVSSRGFCRGQRLANAQQFAFAVGPATPSRNWPPMNAYQAFTNSANDSSQRRDSSHRYAPSSPTTHHRTELLYLLLAKLKVMAFSPESYSASSDLSLGPVGLIRSLLTSGRDLQTAQTCP